MRINFEGFQLLRINLCISWNPPGWQSQWEHRIFSFYLSIIAFVGINKNIDHWKVIMVSQSKCYLLLEFISLLLDSYVTLPRPSIFFNVVNVVTGPQKVSWLGNSWKRPSIARGISCQQSHLTSLCLLIFTLDMKEESWFFFPGLTILWISTACFLALKLTLMIPHRKKWSF